MQHCLLCFGEVSSDSLCELLRSLQLLESVTHCGDNWRRVADHIGRSECVAHFVKLPFGEQFVDPADADVVAEYIQESSPKRMRVTPLADASNPILAQAAFSVSFGWSGHCRICY